MRLNDFEEIIGTLQSVTQENEKTILLFTVEHHIEIPRDAIKNINDFEGKKIAILNLNGSYKIIEKK